MSNNQRRYSHPLYLLETIISPIVVPLPVARLTAWDADIVVGRNLTSCRKRHPLALTDRLSAEIRSRSSTWLEEFLLILVTGLPILPQAQTCEYFNS
jgi:hypothetical protein